jgi:D-2-hydroxyglutarate dehydrogenase
VTAVALQCAPRPASVQLALLACPTFGAVQAVLALARARLGEVLSAFEFLDAASMAMVVAHLPDARNPLAAGGAGGDDAGGDGGYGGGAPFYVLVETSGSDAAHDAAKLERFLAAAMEGGGVADGTIAESGAQADAIWRVREGITESLARRGGLVFLCVAFAVCCSRR